MNPDTQERGHLCSMCAIMQIAFVQKSCSTMYNQNLAWLINVGSGNMLDVHVSAFNTKAVGKWLHALDIQYM